MSFPNTLQGRRDAVAQALKLYWPKTAFNGSGSKEWVGLIYRQGDQLFSTKGREGDEASASQYSSLSDVPSGATVVAFWHTHPTMNMLSMGDVLNVALGFLSTCTPGGSGSAGCPDANTLGDRTIHLEAGYVAGPSRIIFEYAPTNKAEARTALMNKGSGVTQSRAGVVP